MLAQVIWALGFTFISGAVDAWITDEVGANRVQPLFTRSQQLHLGLTVISIVLAGLVGHLDLHAPMVVADVGYLLLAAVMSILMPENGFHPTPRAERETWSHVKDTFPTGVTATRRPGVLRSFMVIALLAGMASEVFDRLWTAHGVDTFELPDVLGIDSAAAWFTVFALAGALVSLAASLLAKRIAAERLNTLHPAGLLATLVLVQAAGVAGFALLGSLWPALSAMWLRDAVRGPWSEQPQS